MKAMTIASLVKTTWLVRYLWPLEIMYDRGGEFIGHKFKSSLMDQEYGINTKPDSSDNPQANATIERIHHVLENLVCTYNLRETYVDDGYPYMCILAAAALAVRSIYHKT